MVGGNWAVNTSSRPATNATQIGTRKPAFQAQSARGQLRLIKSNEVESLIGLSSGHPVYLLTFTDGEKLVLKCERVSVKGHSSIGSASAQAGSVVMSFVSPGNISEVLTPGETKVIAQLPSQLISLAREVDDVKKNKSFFTKMPFVSSLVDLDVHATDDKKKVAAYAAELKGNKELLKEVGKVLAVDLFIGNLDRLTIAYSAADVENDAPEEHDLGIGNYGNFIFKTDAKGRLVGAVGLDSWDPGHPKVATLYGTDIDLWKKMCGILLDGGKGTKRCAEVVAQEFHQEFAKNGINVDFGPIQAKHLNAGMLLGIEALKKKLVAIVRGGKKMPSGIMARADHLGWMKGVFAK